HAPHLVHEMERDAHERGINEREERSVRDREQDARREVTAERLSPASSREAEPSSELRDDRGEGRPQVGKQQVLRERLAESELEARDRHRVERPPLERAKEAEGRPHAEDDERLPPAPSLRHARSAVSDAKGISTIASRARLLHSRMCVPGYSRSSRRRARAIAPAPSPPAVPTSA